MTVIKGTTADGEELPVQVDAQGRLVAQLEAGSVLSDPTGIPGATALANAVVISQAAFDALETTDPNTLYVII